MAAADFFLTDLYVDPRISRAEMMNLLRGFGTLRAFLERGFAAFRKMGTLVCWSKPSGLVRRPSCIACSAAPTIFSPSA